MAEVCTSCGAAIADQLAPRVWEEKIVCGRCWLGFEQIRQLELLRSEHADAASPAAGRRSRAHISNIFLAVFVIFISVIGWVSLLVGLFTSVRVLATGYYVMFGQSALLLISGILVVAVAQSLLCLRNIAINTASLRK